MLRIWNLIGGRREPLLPLKFHNIIYEMERETMGEQKNKKVSEEDALKEAEEMLKRLKEAENKESKPKEEEQVEKEEVAGSPAGEAGDKEENKKKSAKVAEKKVEGVEKKPKKTSTKKKSAGPKIRSKKYQEKLALVDRNKTYSLNEALDLVKKTSYTKFEASVEMHIHLTSPKNKKVKQELRGILQFPHAIGKEPKVGVIDEAMAEKILKDKKTEFDILLAKPEMMPKIARCAKILGPQGKMPNPKTGTVTSDPEKTIKEIKSGRIEYKSDDTDNVHQMIGKVSFDNKKLEENYRAIFTAIGANRIQSVTLSATMGPGVKVRL